MTPIRRALNDAVPSFLCIGNVATGNEQFGPPRHRIVEAKINRCVRRVIAVSAKGGGGRSSSNVFPLAVNFAVLDEPHVSAKLASVVAERRLDLGFVEVLKISTDVACIAGEISEF